MFEKEWLPYALSIGVSYNDFWHMNPRRIKAFEEAHRKKTEMLDEQMWLMGIYIQSAVSVAVEHNLAGKKARSKYIEKPIMQEIEKQQKEKVLTEEEKKQKTEQLFMQLKIMGANFNLNHNRGGSVS